MVTSVAYCSATVTLNWLASLFTVATNQQTVHFIPNTLR